MRHVLFDEGMPRQVRRDLSEFAVCTVQEEGWSSLQNGELLTIASRDFEVFVTADKNLRYQQNIAKYDIDVVVVARSRFRRGLYTSEVEYEWDPDKDRINREKHGVSFVEASTVFLDPLQVTVRDERHSIGELRFRTIGLTTTNRLVIVAHSDREDRIRIITAREATPRERRQYEQQT